MGGGAPRRVLDLTDAQMGDLYAHQFLPVRAIAVRAGASYGTTHQRLAAELAKRGLGLRPRGHVPPVLKKAAAHARETARAAGWSLERLAALPSPRWPPEVRSRFRGIARLLFSAGALAANSPEALAQALARGMGSNASRPDRTSVT
ncbi:hypothetical protein [Actinomadura craniellae]|nr:hypothetical protein [Actinomadura craniellae]